MMMDFFFCWIQQMMLNPCISMRSMTKQDMMILVRYWLARLIISPFFPQTLQEYARASDREMLNLLSSDGILPYKLYKGSALFLWNCGSRLMVEWALLTCKMRKLLELVPGIQRPMHDCGLFFISTCDPDAFTLWDGSSESVMSINHLPWETLFL